MMIIAFILVSYALLVLTFWIGWKSAISKHASSGTFQDEFISVVIPVRNEAHQIDRLLNDLARQHYSHFQVIIVDDHSTDDSLKLLKGSVLPQLTVVSNPGSGKKSALTAGVRFSEGQIIATTDADCSLPADWLKTINQYFANRKIAFVFGPVRLKQTASFFSALQAIEFASLIGTGAATAALGRPIICNGANLAYRKDVFEAVNGYEGNLHIPSGDDEFLMRKVQEKYPGGVHFAQTAVVETTASKTLHALISQRMRWASKWRYNTSAFAVLVAIFILLSQAASICCMLSLLTSVSYWAMILLFLKAVVEAVFLLSVCSFLKIRWNWLAFTVLQVGYPIYVLGVGIASNFISYSWKDRKIR
jgi:cellulose synthase/poly-beta-1,6-N-acetylglucosamine synthase-like glycosyltransferase